MAVATLPEPARADARQRRPARQPIVRDLVCLFRQALSGRAVGLALLGASLVWLLNARFESGAAAPLLQAPAPTRAQQWVAIEHPTRLFTVDSPSFGKAPHSYEARRAVPGGGRRDRLAFGRFGGAYLDVSLYRIGSEPVPEAPFFVSLARRAAVAGLAVTRSDQPAPLATRWGEFETADVVLARQAEQRACLGFRFRANGAPLRMAGFACGGPDRLLGRRQLACSLDRLALVSAGNDAVLGRYFKVAQGRRDRGCGDLRPERHSPRKKTRN